MTRSLPLNCGARTDACCVETLLDASPSHHLHAVFPLLWEHFASLRELSPATVLYPSARKFLRRKHRVEVVLDSRRSSSLAVSARSMASAGGISNWFDKVER